MIDILNLLYSDDPLIGLVTVQRKADGGLIAMQHRITPQNPTADEFVNALRWLADAEALIKSGELSRLEAMSQPMWICTECGNKRCAKASDCAKTCDNGAAEVAANKAREKAIKDECERRGITRRELQQERIARFLETGELPG